MKTISHVAFAALLCSLVGSCSDNCHRPGGGGGDSVILYYNSFESASDTTGWTGITDDMFVSEPSPGGGEQSLCIGGGCIQPTAYIVMRPQVTDTFYSLSCRGKLHDESQRGAVVLATNEERDKREAIGLLIDCAAWRPYLSATPLYCPAGAELRIEISIGGLIGASMLLDCIKVEVAD